jgi:CubicO group peptidase (beta-lactamase class C family)
MRPAACDQAAAACGRASADANWNDHAPTLAEPQNGFAAVHATLKRFIDTQVLPGASLAVVQGDHVIHSACLGWADIERRITLREDHILRVFSNTKLVTACAALLLVDEGRLDLDEPIARWLPAFARPRVLRPAAAHLDDTEPAAREITARQLMTHTAGFSYANVRPHTPLGQAYERHRILLDENQPLEGFVHSLSALPLLFHPGSAWEYSVGSDVLARLIEVISGQEFSRFLDDRVFCPLGMVDTGFWVRREAQHRLAALYRGSHADQPLRGGLERCEEIPFRGAYLRPCALRSGGGGLVSTLSDMTMLLRSLVSSRFALLSPTSRRLMLQNHLPPGAEVRFPDTKAFAGRGYSVAGSIALEATPLDPPEAVGELQWGGIAGTHWWVSPATDSAVVLMTQRYRSFWNLFAFQARRDIYAALRRRHAIARSHQSW